MVSIVHSKKCSICEEKLITDMNDIFPRYQKCCECKKVFFICDGCLGCKCPCCGGNLKNKEETFPFDLFHAIERNDLERVKVIWGMEDQDINFVFHDKTNDTPLMMSGVKQNHEMCLWFINKCNASVRAKNKSGRTPLVEMVRCRGSKWSKTVAQLFADSVNDQDRSGYTALMLASEGAGLFCSNRGNLTIIKQLLEFGADVFIKDNNGETALDKAIQSNKRSKTSSNQKVVDYLEQVETNIKKEVKANQQKNEIAQKEGGVLEKKISELNFKCTNDILPTVEVDLGSIPEEYQGYKKIVDQVLFDFISESPQAVITIYVYQTESVNFIDHMAYSAFFGIAGKRKLQEKLLDRLLAAFNHITGVNARFSDYINTTIGICEFHIENELVWQPIDSTMWSATDKEDEEDVINNIEAEGETDSMDNDEDALRSAIPTRYRAARADAEVGTIRSTIENIFGLPEGSVALCDPTGKALRADATIRTLRRRWE